MGVLWFILLLIFIAFVVLNFVIVFTTFLPVIRYFLDVLRFVLIVSLLLLVLIPFLTLYFFPMAVTVRKRNHPLFSLICLEVICDSFREYYYSKTCWTS